MNKREFVKRTARIIEQERKGKETWLYISFADESGFRGAVITQAYGVVDASLKCHRLGINPGGEMAVWDIDEDKLPPPECRDTLLTKKQVKMIWPDAKRLGDLEVNQ